LHDRELAVVLVRLADARADGDTIDAVVRGVGMNNDGSSKEGYTGRVSRGEPMPSPLPYGWRILHRKGDRRAFETTNLHRL